MSHAEKVAHLRAAKEEGSRHNRSSLQTASGDSGAVLVGEYVTKQKVKGIKQGLKEWVRDEVERSRK